jgi:acyl-CoA thioesterase FadM
MPYFWLHKKIHWSDCDAAGVVWFPNFLGWFEDAEEELYSAVLGRTRQSLLDDLRFGMPRVEVSTKYRAPVRAGQLVRIGIASTLENPRRLRHDFQIREDSADTLLAEGFVRVACVDLASFIPRDLPDPVREMVQQLPVASARQARGELEIPWV